MGFLIFKGQVTIKMNRRILPYFNFSAKKIVMPMTLLISSHDFASGSDITSCNKIDNRQVAHRFIVTFRNGVYYNVAYQMAKS